MTQSALLPFRLSQSAEILGDRVGKGRSEWSCLLPVPALAAEEAGGGQEEERGGEEQQEAEAGKDAYHLGEERKNIIYTDQVMVPKTI